MTVWDTYRLHAFARWRDTRRVRRPRSCPRAPRCGTRSSDAVRPTRTRSDWVWRRWPHCPPSQIPHKAACSKRSGRARARRAAAATTRAPPWATRPRRSRSWAARRALRKRTVNTRRGPDPRIRPAAPATERRRTHSRAALPRNRPNRCNHWMRLKQKKVCPKQNERTTSVVKINEHAHFVSVVWFVGSARPYISMSHPSHFPLLEENRDDYVSLPRGEHYLRAW